MLTQLDPRATRRSVVRDDALVVSLGAVGVVRVCHRPSGNGADPVLLADKSTWRMPPLAELTKPAWSFSRKVGMYTLRVYLLLAISMLIAKVVAVAITGPGGAQ